MKGSFGKSKYLKKMEGKRECARIGRHKYEGKIECQRCGKIR